MNRAQAQGFGETAMKTRREAESWAVPGLVVPTAPAALAAAASEPIRLTTGDDTYQASDADDVVLALAGDDRVLGERGNDVLRGSRGHDVLIGDVGDDVEHGGSGNDSLSGDRGHDTLYGGAGNDIIHAGTQKDIIVGGSGADSIQLDDNAARPDGVRDTVIYESISDSSFGSLDQLDYFEPGIDRIDLSAIDADVGTSENDAFHFIKDAAFSGIAGELRFDPAEHLLEGDIDGDGQADLVIDFFFPLPTNLYHNDFVL